MSIQTLPKPRALSRCFSIFAIMAGLGLLGKSLPSAKAQLWTWTRSTNAPSLQWRQVTSSADGIKLAALAYDCDAVFTSTNAGQTWVSNNIPDYGLNWIASSADGTRLEASATVFTGQAMYLSTNGGSTWTPSGPELGFEGFGHIASSIDGMNLISSLDFLVANNQPFEVIVTSPDGGNTWNTTSLASELNWNAIACSADGSKIIAALDTNEIFTSADNGATWASNSIPIPYAECCASSADGTKLAIGSFAVDVAGRTVPGAIFLSTDSGNTWVSNNAPDGAFVSMAESADGTVLATTGPYTVFTSTNFGGNWSSNNLPSSVLWESVAMSADGSRMVAASQQGPIYTAQLAPPSLSASISGAGMTFSWPGSATNYQLQRNFTLISDGWTAATDPVLFTNGQYQIIVLPTNAQAFYRLQGN